jgi:hypothetical protein
MTLKVWNEKGELQVETTETTTIEEEQRTQSDLIELLLLEAKKQTLHLAAMSRLKVRDKDVR